VPEIPPNSSKQNWVDYIPLWCILGWAVSAPVSIAVSQVFIGLSFAAILLKITFRLAVIPHSMREPVQKKSPSNPVSDSPLPNSKSTSILLLAIAIWLLSQIPSLLASPEPKISWLGFGSSEWLIILCLSVLWSGATNRWIFRWMLGLGIVSSIAAIYALWQHFQGWNDITGQSLVTMGQFSRAEGFFNSCMTLAGFQLAIFSVIGTLTISKLPPKPKWIWGLISLLVGLSLVTTYARGAWIAAIIIILILLINSRVRHCWIWFMSIMIAVIGILLLMPETLGRLESVFQIKNSGRLALWQGAIEMWKSHPWTGIGIGRFQEVFPTVYNGSSFVDSYCHAHSDPLNRLTETGIVGFTGALVFWGVIAWMGWQAWKTENPNARVLAGQAASMGLLALWIAGWSQCYYTDAEVGAVWWFMVGMTGISGSNISKNGNELE
jgi:O-antigen ligase